MQTPPTHPLLEVKQEEMERVRRCLDLDRAKISKNLDAIQEWLKKEDHLAMAMKYLDSNSLERLLLIEKGSVERTKLRIDRLLTTRKMLSEISLNKTIDEFDELINQVVYLPLPKLSPADVTRVTVLQLVSEKGNNTVLLHFLRYVFLVLDYCMKIEYNLGERYILDLKHFNLKGLSMLNPFVLKKGEVLLMQGYGLRVKGFHLVNATSFVDKVVTLLKSTLSEKISQRVFVHNSIEELHKEIPKEVLPQEYGGDLESASVLHEKWKNTLRTDEAKKIIERTNKLVSDESKRSCYNFNTEYLGLPGSFNQLVVD